MRGKRRGAECADLQSATAAAAATQVCNPLRRVEAARTRVSHLMCLACVMLYRLADRESDHGNGFPSGTRHIRALHAQAPPALAALQIDVSDPAQIAHWCREFSCTWLELFSAIDRVGPNVSSVSTAVRNALR